jgi:hypothetical protein
MAERYNRSVLLLLIRALKHRLDLACCLKSFYYPYLRRNIMIRYTKNVPNLLRGDHQLTSVLLAGILSMASALAIAGEHFDDTGTDTYKAENRIDQKHAGSASGIAENLDREPCINGEVSSTGLFVTQALED